MWSGVVRQDEGVKIITTVCDTSVIPAACIHNVCPVWPGQPMTAHWEVTDPAIDVGDLDRQWYQFQCAWHELDNRIKIFTSLTIAGLDRLSLQNRLNEIGNARAGEPEAADETA